MLISADEASGIIKHAVRETARKLGIADVDYVPAAELLDAIRERDTEAYELVQGFALAYGDWFRLVQRLETTHPNGAQSDRKAASDLIAAIQARDDSRSALLAWLRG